MCALARSFTLTESVTSKFPDGNFSRPHLAAFAFLDKAKETHASLRFSIPNVSRAVGSLEARVHYRSLVRSVGIEPTTLRTAT